MRFRSRLHLEHGLKQIDIAPLVDMVFLLLIFFLLTSNFVVQPGIKVKLPKAVTSSLLQDKNVVIMISSENIIYVENKIFSTDELKGYLKKLGKNSTVLIKADKRVSLGRVVEVWDICRDSGIEQLNIATTY